MKRCKDCAQVEMIAPGLRPVACIGSLLKANADTCRMYTRKWYLFWRPK